MNLTDKSKHCRIELLRFLQGSEMAHAVQYDEFRIRNAPRQIFGMFTLDEFVMLASAFRVPAKTAIRLARGVDIPALRLEKHWRFRRSDLAAWVSARNAEARSALQHVLRQEDHIRRTLRQPPHEVGIPLRAERHIHPHPVAFLDQRTLQIAAHSVEHLELKG